MGAGPGMRIGIDARPLAHRSGGIRRYVERLVGGLARIDGGTRYVLYGAPSRPGPGAPEPGSGFERRDPGSAARRALAHLHVAEPPGGLDLFHATNYLPPLLDRRPSVLTVHDLSVHLFPQHHSARRRLRHRFLPGACRRAVHVIAVSNATKFDLVRHFGLEPDRITVVPLAVADSFRPLRTQALLQEVRARLALPERFVLFAGSLHPRKNVEGLIEAMAGLAGQEPEVRLVVAGEGEAAYVEALRRLARRWDLESERRVVFTGYVADRDLRALYSLCELFVYPSLYEGFGLPPLEAMACGAPVLVPAHSSLEELYKESSAQVAGSDPAVLARAIRDLLRDSRRRRELGRRGLARSQRRSWEDVARETLAVYRRGASGGIPRDRAGRGAPRGPGT